MSTFNNLSSAKVYVGETEIQAFHIPVDEPSPRHRKTAASNQQQQQQLPGSANKYAVSVPRTIAGPGAHSSLLTSPPRVPQTIQASPHARGPAVSANVSAAWAAGPPNSTSPGPRPPQTVGGPRAPQQFGSPSPGQQQRGSVMGPPTPSTGAVSNLVQPFSPMSPPSVNSPSPSPAPPSTLSKRPGLNRVSSFTDEKTMAEMGLSRPVIQRLASVDASAVASMQRAREAAKPEISKAERYRNLTCPRLRSNGTYALYDIWKFTDKDFLAYGLGVALWFKLVRRLSYLFLFLFLLNLPSLVFNIAGPDAESIAWMNPAESSSSVSAAGGTNGTLADPLLVRTGTVDGTYGLSKSTLAHQGLVLNATIMGYSKQEIGLVTGSLDTLATLIYFIAIYLIFRDHTKQATSYNSSVLTVRRFTVLVTNLPDTKPVLGRLDIAEFFEKKFGPVVDVSIAYNDMHLIQLFKERGEMKKELTSLEIQGLDEERDELAKKLVVFDKTILFKRKIFRKQVRAAFVTFQHQESVSKCLAAYPNSWLSQYMLPRAFRFHMKAPRVTRAAEPSNTLFHNLGLSYGDQWCRRAWTGLVSLAFMSVSFIAVFISQYYQNRLPTTMDCATQPVTSQDQVTDQQSKFCYCGGLSADELYGQSSFCGSYLAQYAIAKGLIFMTAFSTVLVNFLLQVFMDRLAVLERHSSVTSQQRGVTSRLFWGLFFNTGVIILIVNADLATYLARAGGDFALFRALLPGKYSELSPDWFFEVGVSILITMFLNTQNPHIVSLMAIPYDSCRRKHCAKRRKNQNELNELYNGRRFVLYERYSVLLNTVFVCMMFSSGMPILWLVASVTFACTYWFDKTTFLRSYRIPPRYDESLDEYAADMLPFSVVPHLLMAMWFFTSPMTNSFPLGDAVPLVSDSGIGPIRTEILDWRQRFFCWNTFPGVLLLLLLTGLYCTRRLLSFIFFCRANEAEQRAQRLGVEEKKSSSRAETYQAASQNIGLESYRLSRQSDYRAAYIETESRKQLPPELDLYQLREQLDYERKHGKKKKQPSSSGGNKVAPAPAASKNSVIQVGPSKTAASSGASSTASPASKYAVHSPLSTASPTPPTVPNQAWTSTSGPARQPSPPSETKVGGGPNSTSRAGHVSTASESLSGPSLLTNGPPVQTHPVASANASQNPIAAINHMSDAVVLTMAAAVADSALSPESMGYTLLPIACETCANVFQIVDCGEAMSYTCPFCGKATII